MKKWRTSLLLFLISFVAVAQEVAEETAESTSRQSENWFSIETRWTMVYVFAIAVIIIVLRAFRNKPEI